MQSPVTRISTEDPEMSTPGMTSDIDRGRNHLVRRGRRLAWFTIGWNLVEGVSAIAAGVMAGSIVLIGFGVDSYIEVFAGGVVLWRLAKEKHGEEISATAEGRALRLIAVTFFVLAVGIGTESVRRLITGARPAESLFGIVIAALSVIAMPLLAGAKRRVGEQLGSRALVADAGETMFCAWLSVILLAGLGLNALFGWWWADPIAALGIVYFAFREGVENWPGDEHED